MQPIFSQGASVLNICKQCPTNQLRPPFATGRSTSWRILCSQWSWIRPLFICHDNSPEGKRIWNKEEYWILKPDLDQRNLIDSVWCHFDVNISENHNLANVECLLHRHICALRSRSPAPEFRSIQAILNHGTSATRSFPWGFAYPTKSFRFYWDTFRRFVEYRFNFASLLRAELAPTRGFNFFSWTRPLPFAALLPAQVSSAILWMRAHKSQLAHQKKKYSCHKKVLNHAFKEENFCQFLSYQATQLTRKCRKARLCQCYFVARGRNFV